MSSKVDSLTLQPSLSEPGEVDVVNTSTAGDVFLGADSLDLSPRTAEFGVGEQDVPRPVVGTVTGVSDSTHTQAAQATLAETIKNAANTVSNAASTVTDAVNRSGAIPKAKEMASNVASTLAAGARKTGNVVSQAVSQATAPSAEVEEFIDAEESARTIETTSAPVETVQVPAGATIIVPEGTTVLTAPSQTVTQTETTGIGAPDVVSGAKTAGSTAGSIAGTIAGTVSTAASMAKNVAASATNKVFGAGTTEQLGQNVSNAGGYVQAKAQNAKESVMGGAENLKESAQGTAQNLKESAQGTAQDLKQSTEATAEEVKSTTESKGLDFKSSAQAMARNIGGSVQQTAENVKVSAQETVQEVQQQGIKPTATSVLSKAGSVAGSVIGTVAGTVVAATSMATHAAQSALGKDRTVVETEAQVVPDVNWSLKHDVGAELPVQTIHEQTPRERGEQRAHEIEERAADYYNRAADTVIETKDQAVNTAKGAANAVVNSKPVQATTAATKQAYDKAQETTIAAGTVAGDVAHAAYDKTAQAAYVAKDVASTAYGKTAQVAGSAAQTVQAAAGATYNKAAATTQAAAGTAKNAAAATYNTAANATHAVTDTARNVAGATYNTAANVTTSATNTAKNAAAATYNTAANVTTSATNTAKNVAGATYNTAASATHAATETAKNAAAATYNTAANVTHAATDTAKNAASATYNTAANATQVAAEKTKNAAGATYNTAASTAQSASNTLKHAAEKPSTSTTVVSPTESHLRGSPAGIAGPYGSSAPGQAYHLSGDSAIAAVSIPSDQRTPAQQAAVDAALSRTLEPIGIASPADYDLPLTEVKEIQATAAVPLMDMPEVDLGVDASEATEYALADPLQAPERSDSYGARAAGGSVLPSDLSPKELQAPPSDDSSTRSIPPASSLKERISEFSESPRGTTTTSTYDSQRAESPSHSAEGTTADLTRTNVTSAPTVRSTDPASGTKHHHGLMEKVIGKMEKVFHKDHIGTGHDKHHVAGAAEGDWGRRK